MSASTQREGGTKGRGWTPGPWELDGGVVRGWTDDHKRPICEIYRELRASDETIANAHLIAAAPELFEALQASQKAIRELRTNGAPTSFWDDIEAANIAALSRAVEVEHG